MKFESLSQILATSVAGKARILKASVIQSHPLTPGSIKHNVQASVFCVCIKPHTLEIHIFTINTRSDAIAFCRSP